MARIGSLAEQTGIQSGSTGNIHDTLIAEKTKKIGLIEKAMVKRALRSDVKPAITGATTTTGKDYEAHVRTVIG